ncbi:MAG: hypothetical protein IJ617_08680 [Oscillospiraceae bacterium]|nr:hypothetical protein [Oscillospiraceae bacterium]
MRDHDRIKRWEMALALSLCLTIFHGALFGGAGMAWWGVVFPGLTGAPEAVEAAALQGEGGPELRLWVLDWLRGLL